MNIRMIGGVPEYFRRHGVAGATVNAALVHEKGTGHVVGIGFGSLSHIASAPSSPVDPLGFKGFPFLRVQLPVFIGDVIGIEGGAWRDHAADGDRCHMDAAGG